MVIHGFKGEIAENRATLKKYSRDASLFEVMPRAVVFPRDADDVKVLVKFVNDNHHLKLSLTARAAGTDMTGGPLNKSIIVDFTRHMNRIKEIGYGQVIVEPGAYYREVEKALAKKGLLLPSYPASKNLCAVGGMVANNSGGEKTLVYGKTERYVKKLKAVLADGNEYELKPLHAFEVRKKIHLPTFEGALYRELWQMFEKHDADIMHAKPHVSKNSAGYSLWNVWHPSLKKGQETFNAGALLVGAQGTLGLITEITFKVIRPKTHARMLVMMVNAPPLLARLIPAVLEHRPESFESYDRHTLWLGVRYLAFRFIGQFIPELWMIIKNKKIPQLVLLAEFTDDSEKGAERKVRTAEKGLEKFGLVMRVTHSARDAEKYWAVRRESFQLLRTKVRGRYAAPFIDDVIVAPAHVPQFLPELQALLAPYEKDMTYTVAGHMGDGNFHIIPLIDLKSAHTRAIIPQLTEKVYALVLKYKGSITAEHNDGIIRTPYLKTMYGEKIYALFEKVKYIFDPHNIFNPGKKVGGTKEYAMDHMRKE